MRIHRAVAAGAIAAAVFPALASAHAVVSPNVVKAKTLQFFTLSVPTEKESATTTSIELTPPSGFAIDSFSPNPGWKRRQPKTRPRGRVLPSGRTPTPNASTADLGGGQKTPGHTEFNLCYNGHYILRSRPSM